ncbi:MAG: leucyl/phenylalanyl-tRNA--protein transferase [Proteobacteria bacterium]|nr:leucyl/phenylalanyl-tRNA--protein transferase [Pseudomonadota bacterium]
MVIEAFPPVSDADEFGLLAVGGDLEVPSLLLAYRNGVFPWPLNARTLTWFAPPQRAVLFLKDFHCSRSLQKAIRNTTFRFAINRNFPAVISSCAESCNRKGERGTWITNDIVRSYTILHEAGFAHSFECYEGDTLVGGVYGVSIGGLFAAESMFYRKPNSSKMTLQFMINFLIAQDVPWIDAQVMNPFLQTMGFVEISRGKYMKLLPRALSKAALRFPAPRNDEAALELKLSSS